MDGVDRPKKPVGLILVSATELSLASLLFCVPTPSCLRAGMACAMK
jgi:hypothetical protein